MHGMTEKSKFGGGAACTLASQLEKGLKMMYNSNERNYTMGKRFGLNSHCERSEAIQSGLPRHSRSSFLAMTRGFTLAEVLITLAIIGVVAVLTIPTLIVNYQQRGWNTSATVFERKLEESLRVMNTQGTLAGYKTTEEFVNELQKHLKITKVCKNDDLTSCFEDKILMGKNNTEVDLTNISIASDFGLDWGTNLVGIQLNNGTNGIIGYNPNCRQDPYSNQINGSSCIAILYDTSGYTKPNYLSKDLRKNQNIKKIAGKTICVFEIAGTCYGAPFFPQPLSKAECLERYKDLGFNHNCYFDYNYWAGAVADCGGVDKMPTMAQLAEIAQYLYPSTVGTGTSYCPEDSNGLNSHCRDNERVLSLGFSVSSNSVFKVWSGKEYSGGPSAWYKYFYISYAMDQYANTNNSNIQAMCIAD